MSKLACKICPKCQKHNNISSAQCECGTMLDQVPGRFCESNDLEIEELISVREYQKIFVQICPACSAKNLTSELSAPVTKCYNCNKVRIASQERKEYTEETRETETEEAFSITEEQSLQHFTRTVQPNVSPIDEEDSEEEICSTWESSGILDSIRESVRKQANQYSNISKMEQEYPYSATMEDSEDEDNVDWPEDIIKSSTHIKNKTDMKVVVLTDVRNDNISYNIEIFENMQYMIGREANMSERLNNDIRIGRKHCHLTYREGDLMVVDHSQAGTFVNRRDIGEYGEETLHNGDTITLGHDVDSITFRVTII